MRFPEVPWRAPARARPLAALALGAVLTLLVPAAVSLAEGAEPAEVIEGRAVAVHDGDTITVLSQGAERRIRLSGIDTPERGQPWATRAKQALSERVFGKEVRVIAITRDAYGRIVGEVYADEVCVGCELVRGGHAWVYRRYTDDEVLLALEADAREAGRGLWGLPESQRTPPWEWRRARRSGARSPGPPARADYTCGAKRTCGEMASCREARFHHETCGLGRLDGDDDGVPCEKLCR